MTYLNLSAVRRTPLILDESDAERQAANSDYADVRRSRHLIRFFVDKSGSMYKLLPDVLDAVVRGAETARENEVEDYDTVIQVICFDSDVHEVNAVPLPPAEFLDGFDPGSIQANGSTAIGRVIEYMTRTFTHENPFIEQNLHGPAPAITDILLTDLKATDSKTDRRKNIDKLGRNNLAKRRQDLLVINMGDEDPLQNEELIQLVRGKTENIMRISTYQAQTENLLAARICQSIISMSDPTYMKSESAGDTYLDAVSTTETEKQSAAALSTSLYQDAQALRAKMSQYFSAPAV